MATKTVRRRDGQVTVIAGATGSGKTSAGLQQTANDDALLVWDLGGEVWPNVCDRVTTWLELDTRLNAALEGGRCRIAFAPDRLNKKLDFTRFSERALTWALGRQVTIVAEELADVSTPGKAPDGWGELVRRGRVRGVDLIAIMQRVQETDKTIIGQAARVVCLRLATPDDRDYMARKMGLNPEQRARLDTLKKFEFCMRNMASDEVIFSATRPPK
jgi:hypothetical protein